MLSVASTLPRLERFSLGAYQADFSQHGFYLCYCDSLTQLGHIVEQIGPLCAHDQSGVTFWDVKPRSGLINTSVTADAIHESASSALSRVLDGLKGHLRARSGSFLASSGISPSSRRSVYETASDNKKGARQPRSRTADEFTFHTDASFEDPPPRGIGLYVVHADRFGGGITRLVDWKRVAPYLSEADKALLREPFPMRVPPEFIKDCERVSAPILMANDGIRYRRETLEESLISEAHRDLLNRLDQIINMPTISFDLLLPTGALICIDNYRILHARTAIKDPERHLVRFRYSL